VHSGARAYNPADVGVAEWCIAVLYCVSVDGVMVMGVTNRFHNKSVHPFPCAYRTLSRIFWYPVLGFLLTLAHGASPCCVLLRSQSPVLSTHRASNIGMIGVFYADPGLGSPLPRLRRDCARRYHICTGTALTPATSAPGLRSPVPHLRQDCARPCHDCDAQRRLAGCKHHPAPVDRCIPNKERLVAL
jgi:hypothetical protein